MMKRKYKMKPLFKHQVLITGLSVFVVVIATLSSSYAVFSKTKQNDEYNVVSVGDMELSYVDLSDNGNALTLADEFPVEDAVGSQATPYRFSVENTGTLPAVYKIKVSDDTDVITADGCSDNLIAKSNLKIKFDNDDPVILSTYEEDGFIIYSASLQPAESDIHEIRVWISDESGNEVLGQHFHGKVSVVLEQELSKDYASNFIMNLAETNTNELRIDEHEATGNQTFASTDYRYYGANPDNYVTFNNELWRIIGVMDVENEEGNVEKRVKLIRNESIGNYSWDSSASTVNRGWGINEWSQADVKTLLNDTYYYNSTVGTCYNASWDGTSSCDFTANGLKNEAKSFISSVKWYTGAANTNDNDSTIINVINAYENERSLLTGKSCLAGDDCNDTVSRKTTWIGEIGVMYPSDYGYAADISCSSTSLYSYNLTCASTDWLFNGDYQWMISPYTHSSRAAISFFIYPSGRVYGDNDFGDHNVRPVVYLTSDVLITGGSGTSENPYILEK